MNCFLKKYASTSRDYDTLSGGTVDHHHLYPHNKADTYFGVNVGAMQDLHFIQDLIISEVTFLLQKHPFMLSTKI